MITRTEYVSILCVILGEVYPGDRRGAGQHFPLEVCGLKVNTRQVLSSWGLRLCLKGIVEIAAHVRLS